MIGRSGLVAFARGEASEADVAAIWVAILAADRAATNDGDGDDEHVTFNTALITAFGLRRRTGRPSNACFAAALSRFRHWQGRNLTHGEIVAALAAPGIVSETTLRNWLRAIDARRAKVATLLASDIAATGRSLMLAEPDSAILHVKSL